MTIVDSIYRDLQDAVRIMRDADQISLQIMLEDNLRKTLLLGAASYFEMRLTREVQQFTDHITSGNELIQTLIQQKVISRQYHSWFDWNTNNANKFFSMFGSAFKHHMATRIANDPQLGEDVRAFIMIGRERNFLVHSDYGNVYIDRTPVEIYDLYLSASRFVDTIGVDLRRCSENNLTP